MTPNYLQLPNHAIRIAAVISRDKPFQQRALVQVQRRQLLSAQAGTLSRKSKHGISMCATPHLLDLALRLQRFTGGQLYLNIARYASVEAAADTPGGLCGCCCGGR